MYGLLVISYDPRAGWIWPYSEHLLTITACMVVISIKFSIHGPWGGSWGVPFGGCLSSDRIGRHKGQGHVLHNSLDSRYPVTCYLLTMLHFFLKTSR